MFHLMGIMYMEKDEKGRDFQNTEMTFEFLWGCGYNNCYWRVGGMLEVYRIWRKRKKTNLEPCP